MRSSYAAMQAYCMSSCPVKPCDAITANNSCHLQTSAHHPVTLLYSIDLCRLRNGWQELTAVRAPAVR